MLLYTGSKEPKRDPKMGRIECARNRHAIDF
jgi:hypothetical protein